MGTYSVSTVANDALVLFVHVIAELQHSCYNMSQNVQIIMMPFQWELNDISFKIL